MSLLPIKIMHNTDDTLWMDKPHTQNPILHHTHNNGPRHLWMLQKYWSQQYSTIISVVGGTYTVSAVYMILHSLAKGSIYILTFYYIHSYLSFCMKNPNWGLLYHEDTPTQKKHKFSVWVNIPSKSCPTLTIHYEWMNITYMTLYFSTRITMTPNTFGCCKSTGHNNTQLSFLWWVVHILCVLCVWF